MGNIDEFLRQGRERMQQYIDGLREANPTEPVIIEGRPFTPDDLQHLDELNEEMLTQNPPKPYQWKKGMPSHYQWEELYFHRPIVTPEPTNKKQKPMNAINFTHLDPEDLHTCQHCQNLYLDVDEGYKCRVHPGIKYTGTQHIAVNTCDDYLTPWVNDYRKRPDLELGLQNHGGR